MSETITKKKNARIASVEFWRFLFTVLVCLYHLEIYYTSGKLFPSGTSAVEFFFVLSGFLIALSAGHWFEKNPQPLSPKEACVKATQFVWKKVKVIFPVIVVTLILHYAMNGGGYSRSSTLEAILNSEWDLLFMVGTPFGYANGGCPIVPLWFLTALFIAGYVYTYMLYRNFHFTLFLAPLIGVLLYSFFTLNSSLVLDFYAKMGFMTAGTVKAFAEVALGIAMYHLYAHLRKKKLSSLWEVVLTILMIFAIYRYFALTIKVGTGLDNFRRIVYIMIIILLSFLNKDLITSVLNHGFARFLGSISMTMYVCHYTLCNYYFAIVGALWKHNPMSSFLRALNGSAGTGFGGYGGGTINWSIRICYILFVMVVAIILHFLVQLVTKALTPKPKAEPPASEIVPAPGAEE
jgi:peptidoglycan/LPS O-acetylase OafA/YrhL